MGEFAAEHRFDDFPEDALSFLRLANGFPGSGGKAVLELLFNRGDTLAFKVNDKGNQVGTCFRWLPEGLDELGCHDCRGCGAHDGG